MYAFLSRAAATAPPADVWTWLSASIPAGAVVNGLGLLSLAALFASDRILTKGQHTRRVADIEAAHAKELEARDEYHAAIVTLKDEAYAELKTSRDYYREARIEERNRADKVTDQLAEVAELARLSTHLLASFDEAAKDAKT